MTRGELSTRIQARLDRYDTTTQTEIDAMIDEVIENIERVTPLAYTKKTQETVLTANEAIYTLPQSLIYHHPFDLLLESTSLDETYGFMVKTADDLFNQWFTDPLQSGVPEYWRITGGADSNEFQVYPVQSSARTIKLGNGYYYSGAAASDATETWLMKFHPNLIIEGVASELFRHYGESDRASEAGALYVLRLYGKPQDGIYGLVPTEKKRNRKGRILRVRTLSDFPSGVALRKSKYGG